MLKKNKTEKEMTMDELARITQEGFWGLEERIGTVEINIGELKTDIEGIKKDIKTVKSDTEDIKADLNKKVDVFTHNDLKFRVEKLEKKFA